MKLKAFKCDVRAYDKIHNSFISLPVCYACTDGDESITGPGLDLVPELAEDEPVETLPEPQHQSLPEPQHQSESTAL